MASERNLQHVIINLRRFLSVRAVAHRFLIYLLFVYLGAGL